VAEERQYQSLYRKYRPQGPQEVLGQEHVIRALMGAVREGRLAHAFLFTGPRGTGKTSSARILAKMVNCEQGPTEDPCGVCEQCTSIRDGSHLDVVEIDAASHGGVDDARELREKAPTAPVQGREKVYIIDEAQRLSREAFDALLKVFEEPPPGVRFVLATTEPHKMPATIIGRCQRFDFRRIPLETVADHLQRVAKDEGVTLSPEAAVAIARQTEGSARDALSLLDQATVLGAGEITEDVVAALVGGGTGELLLQLGDAVSVGDAKAVFEIVERVVQEGQDVRHITNAALAHFRNLLLARTAPDQGELLDVPESEVERLRTQAAKFSAPELARVIALLLTAQADMRWTTSPRLTFELALIRSTLPETDAQPAALLSRIERLERIAGIGGAGAGAAGGSSRLDAQAEPQAASAAGPQRGSGPPSTPAPASRRTKSGTDGAATKASAKAEGSDASSEESRGAASPATPPPAPVLGAGTSAIDVVAIRASWAQLVHHLRSQGKAVLPSFLEVATPAAFDGETLELVFPPDRTFGVAKVEEREGELRGALQEMFGVAPHVRCVVRDSVVDVVAVEEDAPLSEEEALERIKAELGAQESES
jgi:DNA polymerase-3 subunit gamma/tau